MAWHELEDTSVLFYGPGVIVVAKHFTSDRCVVTFTSRMADKDLPGEPFAAGLCKAAGCSYVAFISTSNHWWQVEDFQHAVLTTRRYLDRMQYADVVAYGGSMGGVGVVHASQVLAPNSAVLFAAQYDISPDIVPWDNRWHLDAKTLGVSLKEGSESASRDTQFIYLYDAFDGDRRHYEIFRNFLDITPLNLPLSGHENFRTMKEAGTAGLAARILLFSGLPIKEKVLAVKLLYRKSCRKSATYWRNVLKAAGKHKKTGLTNYAIERLSHSDGQDLGTLHSLALAFLVDKSDADRAEKIYDRCIQLDPDHPAAWRGKAKCRQAKNDRVASIEFALAALARKRDSEDLRRVVIEAAYRASDQRIQALAGAIYLASVRSSLDEDFIRRYVPAELLQLQTIHADDIVRFEANLTTIQSRRPRRYSQLFQCLAALKPKTIVEIGVYNGENAIQMFEAAQSTKTCDRTSFYYGFDLFEDMTSAINTKEFSKIPLSKNQIAERLSAAGISHVLTRGYSQDTLPKLSASLKSRGQALDFVFLDGGHRQETIASDWSSIAPLMHGNSVVILDDYYVGRPPELDGLGCNDLVTRLSGDPNYLVEILPIQDVFFKPFKLTISMVKIRPAPST